MIEAHYVKMNKMVIKLMKNNRKNPYVISILLTETFFRSILNMQCEILYWYFCSIFKPNRMGRISVGLAQMQIKNWVKFGYFKDYSPSLEKVAMVFDPIRSYDICQEYLLSEKVLESGSLIKIAKFYRGRLGKYYYNTMLYCFLRLKGE